MTQCLYIKQLYALSHNTQGYAIKEGNNSVCFTEYQVHGQLHFWSYGLIQADFQERF